jgi:phosphoglucan,water dikinase
MPVPQGGYASLAGGNDRAWSHPMAALVLGLRHMGLSGWCQAECMALEGELHAWQEAGNITDKTNALR